MSSPRAAGPRRKRQQLVGLRVDSVWIVVNGRIVGQCQRPAECAFPHAHADRRAEVLTRISSCSVTGAAMILGNLLRDQRLRFLKCFPGSHGTGNPERAGPQTFRAPGVNSGTHFLILYKFLIKPGCFSTAKNGTEG